MALDLRQWNVLQCASNSVNKANKTGKVEGKANNKNIMINKESNSVKRNWVDHQACSMLQYINIVTNLFYNGKLFY